MGGAYISSTTYSIQHLFKIWVDQVLMHQVPMCT